jgi:curved DNA-binding protein
MAFIDYYKILGVDRNIPQKDVRRAFLKRAKQFHPDLHPDDPKAKAKFQALNEAYEVIGDSEKRKKYDQFGQNWKEADAFNQAGGNGGGSSFHWSSSDGGSPFDGFDFSGFGSGGGFSSFFEDLFGHGAGHGFSSHSARTSTGEMNAKVNIDLYTALLGGEVIIQLRNGSKIKLKVKPETQNGTRVRLRGKGYDRGDGTFGDLIITYNVTLPTNLSDRQKQLLNEMRYAG